MVVWNMKSSYMYTEVLRKGISNTMIIATSSLTTKSQITIPKQIREFLEVGPGESVQFTVDADGRVVLESTRKKVRALAGSLAKFAEGVPSLSDRQLDDLIGSMVAEEYLVL